MEDTLINTNLVNLDLCVTNPSEAIRDLVDLIDRENRLFNKNIFLDSVLKRELEASTEIGFQFAIPHGKCSSVKTPTLVFGRLSEPLKWSESSEGVVKNLLLIAVPEKCKGDLHLKILSSLCRKLMHEDFRFDLEQATDEHVVVNLLDDNFVCE